MFSEMHCKLSEVTDGKPELLGSTYKETGDLTFMKLIMKDLAKTRVLVREAPEYFSTRSETLTKSYSERSVNDFLDVMRNLHVVIRTKKETRSGIAAHWKLTSLGQAWAIFSPEDIALSKYDEIFLLRHLLMIDSHNFGLWLTQLLQTLEGGGKNIKGVTAEFVLKLSESNCRIGGSAVHKVLPALEWLRSLGLVRSVDSTYILTDSGRTISSLHPGFFKKGLEEFRETAALRMVESGVVVRPHAEPYGDLNDIAFKKSILSIARSFRQSGMWPAEIPSLRSAYCTQLIAKGVAMSDANFEAKMIALSKSEYYKFVLIKSSRVTTGYPYTGLRDGDNEYYFFDIIG
jgi:hypothetical protein